VDRSAEVRAAVPDVIAARAAETRDPRIEVVGVEEVPLTYLVDPAIRIRVNAVGPRAEVRPRAGPSGRRPASA
jgi:hypothetical protein